MKTLTITRIAHSTVLIDFDGYRVFATGRSFHGLLWRRLLLFTASSALCGLAPSLALLIAARAVQGVGGALVMAVSPAMLTSAFPAREAGARPGHQRHERCPGGPAHGILLLALDLFRQRPRRSAGPVGPFRTLLTNARNTGMVD